jgi:ABC-type multidrug transport system ATPase subunit
MDRIFIHAAQSDLESWLCLDAFTAYLLLQNLSALAKKGRTIILSIHAPRSDAWKLFDRIVLLTKGQVAYSGKKDDCLAWFDTLGQKVENRVNPLG